MVKQRYAWKMSLCFSIIKENPSMKLDSCAIENFSYKSISLLANSVSFSKNTEKP